MKMEHRKADQSTVRQLNLSIVLKLLRERGTLARADLAKEMGMTRNTASNVVAELIDAGLVAETEYRREGVGRPGLLLELSPGGGYAIGAEIDVSRIIVVAVDFKTNILWEETAHISLLQSQEEIISMAEQMVRTAMKWGKRENLRPLGIGLGLAGLVDVHDGILMYAPTLHWNHVPFKQLWEKKFGVVVYVDNEANTSALGYYAYVDRHASRNLAYLSIGVGMAAGLILDRHPYRGSHGFAGQAGHMKIRPDGDPCSCGATGCWVTEVGISALGRGISQLPGDAYAALVDSKSGKVNMDAVATLLRTEDAPICRIIGHMAERLGLGIANLINLFNLDLIVLGGAIRPILPFILEQTTEVILKNSLPQSGAHVKVRISGRDDDGVIGAGYLVLEAIMNNPAPLVRTPGSGPLIDES